MKINKLKIFFLFLFIVLLISGFYYLKHTWDHTLSLKTDKLTQLALISEASLNGEMLKLLRAIPDDVGTVPYESIKRRLMQLPAIDPGLAFAYIYTQRDNKIYFMADSEPADSPDYSPPGQEYTEAFWPTYQPFKDGLVIVTPPATDRWGTWISILVPMVDSNTGQVTAVLGMDYPAENWTNEAVLETSKSGIAVLFAFIILILFYLSENNFYKVKNSKDRYSKLEKDLEQILDSIPAWVFYKDDKNNFIRINKIFSNVLNKSKDQIEGKSAFDLFPKEQAEAYYKDDLEVIKSGQSKLNIVEKMDSPAGTLWVQTDKILFKDEEGKILGIIGFSLDITKQKNIEDEQKKYNQELEKINKLMIGREMEMINLKKEIANLKKKMDKVINKEEDRLKKLIAEACKTAKVGGWEFYTETMNPIWTDEIYNIYEVNKTEFKADLVKGINFYSPESKPIIEKAVNEAIKTGQSFDLELEIITVKGNHKIVHAIGQGSDIVNGKVKRVSGIFQDITEQSKIKLEAMNRSQELEKLNRLMINRELEMIKLKKEIEDLKNK